MAPDVFISYTQADRIAAEHVCSSLEANGIHCWIAPRNIAPGSEWAEAIMQAIKGAKALVLMLSSHSKGSRQLAREVENADEHGLKIITFRIEDVAPPEDLDYYLRNIQWLDGFGDQFDGAIQRLSETVRALPSQLDSSAVAASVPSLAEVSLGANLEPDIPPSEARQLNWRKPWFLVAGGPALLLVAGLTWHFAGPSSERPANETPPVLAAPAEDSVYHASPKALRLFQKARTEWKDGNKSGATADIAAAISDSPDWPAPYLYRARWEAQTGNKQAALQDYNACIDRKPETSNLISAYRERAQLKQDLGDTVGAQADRAKVSGLQSTVR